MMYTIVIASFQINAVAVRNIVFATLCMVSSFVYSQPTPTPTQVNVTFATGISYSVDSENQALYEDKDRLITIPLRLTIGITPSLNATLRTSLVRTSTQRITSTDAITADLSGLGNSELAFAYRHGSEDSSMWPTWTLTGSVSLLAGGFSVSSSEGEELREGSIGLELEWPFISINGRIESPIGSSTDFIDVDTASSSQGVRSASLGFELNRDFFPVFLSASGDIGYTAEYGLGGVDLEELTIAPGLNYGLQFGAQFFVNEEISFTSTIGASVEKNIRVNNTLIDQTGSESLSLDLGLKCSINRSHSISPSLNIELDDDGRKSALSVSYSHRF